MIHCHVDSEITPLKSVLMHRPDQSIERLNATNCQYLLFDEILDVNVAQQEHDVFTHLLKEQNVNVLLVKDLLIEVLQIEEAKTWLLDQHCSPYALGCTQAEALKQFLKAQSADATANYLLGGIKYTEFKEKTSSLVVHSNAEDFILLPLPNQYYTRDTSFWIDGSVCMANMAKRARRREVLNVEAIYQFHPLFKIHQEKMLFGDKAIDYHETTLEGGDVMVVGGGLILIGLSERTSAQAIECLAVSLFKRKNANKIVVIELPKERRTMHLDTVITMLSYDCFTVYPQVMDHTRAWEIKPKQTGLQLTEVKNLFDYLSRHVGTEIKTVNTGENKEQQQKEQWNAANNVLTVRPGVVIAYQQNQYTIEAMENADITVHTIPSTQLVRGRGGPHCMTCPLERAKP